MLKNMIRWFGLLFMCVTLFAACEGIENLFGGEGLQGGEGNRNENLNQSGGGNEEGKEEIVDKPVLELSDTELIVPSDGGEFEITVKSEGQYYLERPSVPSCDGQLEQKPPYEQSTEIFFDNFYEGEVFFYDIAYSKDIEGNIIRLQVKPAKFPAEKSTSFCIYDAGGAEAGTIMIRQKGNPDYFVDDVPLLGLDGQLAFSNAMAGLRDFYVQLSALENGWAMQGIKKPYSADNQDIMSCWANSYKALSRFLTIKKHDSQALGCYQHFLDVYISLIFYTMSSHWGGVPFYIKLPDNPNLQMEIPKTPETEILTSIIKILDETLPYLEEKRNDSFTDANSVLFTSRDVARVIQAYSYCNLTEYARAGELLEEVIGNGFYKLLDSSSIDYRDNEECILGIIPDRNNIQNYNGECYPCIDYTEVLLTAAECYYCLGDRSRADGYINAVCKAKGLTVDLSEPLKGIAEIRLALQLPNYMTYLRRNSLSDLVSATGQSVEYQLLLPIPFNELELNMSLVQNPGY